MYFNSKGEIVDFNLDVSPFGGKSSEIFHVKDNVYLKRYFRRTLEECRMNYDIFNVLTKLKHPNTNQLIEFYFNTENVLRRMALLGLQEMEQRNFVISNLNNLEIDAYEYLFLDDRRVDIINADSEYLLYNLRELENLMNIFTEMNVCVRDLKRENTVYNGDRIVLIDLDCCKFVDFDKDMVHLHNVRCLKDLFIDLFFCCRGYSGRYEYDVLNLFYSDEDSVTNSVSKKLSKYKTPKDYFKNNL